MKHQISKVAIMATLAFIGVGFVGTQSANAQAPCTPEIPVDRFTCDGEDIQPEQVTTCQEPIHHVEDASAGCWDTDGNCSKETYYSVIVVVADCTRLDGTVQRCDAVQYNADGTCYDI